MNNSDKTGLGLRKNLQGLGMDVKDRGVDFAAGVRRVNRFSSRS